MVTDAHPRNITVVGAQWGDEGKGKLVDLLAERSDAVVRFQGGNNAGHTLVVDGNKTVLHLIPSGALHEGKRLMIGAGVVVDPVILLQEVQQLERAGFSICDRLQIDPRCQLILEPHRRLEAEMSASATIGTTMRGIGPAYALAAFRIGIRVCELVDNPRFALGEFSRAIEPLIRGHLNPSVGPEISVDALYSQLRPAIKLLQTCMSDVALAVDIESRHSRNRVLFEGAQGVLLDMTHGTYPFVTSSNTGAGAVCTGVGVGPAVVGTTLGIAKAYTTRVGEGPFPTELKDAIGQRMRKIGHEFGATTGRPRRCGWLDLFLLRHAIRVGGIDRLALTKADVLTGLDQIKVCTGWKLDGAMLDSPPPKAAHWDQVEPQYTVLDGWQTDITGKRHRRELPVTVLELIEFIEDTVHLPVSILSVGPDRDQTIALRDDDWF